jgi:hypothetical protein
VKEPINTIIFTCGHRGKRSVTTFLRGDEWTRAYRANGPISAYLAKLIKAGVQNGCWVVHPHSMGWTAYRINRGVGR